LKQLDAHLAGKTQIVGNSVTIADLAWGSILSTAFQLEWVAGLRGGLSNLAQWFDRFAALPEVIKVVGAIVLPTVAAADDDLDLFGDDDEEGAAAAKAAVAAAAKSKKKPKKVVIAQSLVLFEVKPLDNETDLDVLGARILGLTGDGIYWKSEFKKEPVAYGIFKIIIGVTVEDDKVSVDALQEQIEAFDDMVQSVEIAAFNKI
jgi:elongation factor 1-beta